MRVVFEVGSLKGSVCSPRPYMLALVGSEVLSRRYCGSKIKGKEAVLNRTSEVRVRKIVKEKGEAVKLN